jgi:L-alanine-DL-glutamate epimerase-like enolase superfamily enzyme
MSEVGPSVVVSVRFATVEVALRRPIQSGRLVIPSRQYCCLRVQRADGTVGDAYVLTRGLSVASVLAEFVLPTVLGSSGPGDERLLVALRNAGWSGAISRAVALVELARHDAAARATGTPVWRVTGHEREPSPAVVVAIGYTEVGADPGTADIAEAEAASALGARMVKLMGGIGSVEDDLARVRRVVAAVGGAVEVGLDVNGAWLPAEAELALPRLRGAGACLAEDPYPYELGNHPHFDEAPLALALGEVLASPLEVSGLLRIPHLTHARLDVTLVGGPALFTSACREARTAGVAVMPHYWPEYHRHLLPPGGAGSDLIECTLPGSAWFGHDQFASGLPQLADGTLAGSTAGGFGLDLDWDAIAHLAQRSGGVALMRLDAQGDTHKLERVR